MPTVVNKIKGLSPWRSVKKLEEFPDQQWRVEKEGYVSLGDRVAVLTQTQGFKQPPPSSYQYQEEPETYESINAHRMDPIDIEHNKQIIEERYISAVENLALLEKQMKQAEEIQSQEASEGSTEPVVEETNQTTETSTGTNTEDPSA